MSAGPVGRREVAVRCFAAEYDDADLSYSESDEERAPNYVVTPTGARINRLFAVGVLTEVEPVSEDVLRGRIVDPTGAFVVYAGQYQPDAKTALERLDPPEFVAVTGKARTFEPDDGDRVYTSIRPESVNAVDAETRDRWTVQAAEHTLERVATCAAALDREERGADLTDVLDRAGVGPALAAGIPRAIDHYGTTPAYLAAVRELAIQAAAVVAGERDEVDPLSVDPDEGGPVDVDPAGEFELGAVEPATGASESVGSEAASTPDAEAEPRVADASDGSEPAVVDTTTGDAVATGESSAESADPVATTTDEPLGDFEAGATADPEPDAGDAVGSTDPPAEAGEEGHYELDKEEVAAVESEFGTEFTTGNEVDAPGEAAIETPGADEPSGEDEATPDDAGSAEGDTGEDTEAATPDEVDVEMDDVEAEADAEAEAEEPVDLVDAVVSTMRDLDDGDGADRSAVIDAVVADHGADEAAVEDAIDEALMGGRCYEPDDGRLKAI